MAHGLKLLWGWDSFLGCLWPLIRTQSSSRWRIQFSAEMDGNEKDSGRWSRHMVSFGSFPNSSDWWWLISSVLFTRTSCRKTFTQVVPGQGGRFQSMCFPIPRVECGAEDSLKKWLAHSEKVTCATIRAQNPLQADSTLWSDCLAQGKMHRERESPKWEQRL